MNRIYGVVLLYGLLFMTMEGMAQQPQIEMDYASFAYDEQESLVELYMAVEANSLTYVADSSVYRTVIPLHLKLVRSSEAAPNLSTDTPIWSQENQFHFALRDTAAITEGQVFLRQIRFTVVPGEYELQVEIPVSGQKKIQARRDLIIPDFSQQNSCTLSDITLASRIVPSNAREDPFYKNGLTILPNPNQLYGEGAKEMFYYAEAYHTACVKSDIGEYTLFTFVTEANGSIPIPRFQKRSRRRVRDTDILVGSFDVDSLVTGTYFLRFVILNYANEAMVEQNRKFFVLNPSLDIPVVPAEPFETSGYASLPEEEVEKGLDHLRVLVTEQEARRIRRVKDLDERRRILRDIWDARDPTPETAVNEFRDEFYTLLMYANERYSVQRLEGWETDRGRVLLKYGRPAMIESHLYERGRKPYEIWKYNNISGEGRADFVFADMDGFGDFELIHSSVAGERKLPDWIREITQGYR